MVLDDVEELYHGSYMVVKKPLLSKCVPGKDFGLGFYLTTDINQAKRFVRSSIGKAKKNGIELEEVLKGYVSSYHCLDKDSLKIYEFETANSEWLHCVVAHRKSDLLSSEINKWKSYDVIIGKIANDTTNQVITAYINGLYGEVGSDEADTTAIRLLKPEKLSNQLCFRTENAINSLTFVSGEEVNV